MCLSMEMIRFLNLVEIQNGHWIIHGVLNDLSVSSCHICFWLYPGLVIIFVINRHHLQSNLLRSLGRTELYGICGTVIFVFQGVLMNGALKVFASKIKLLLGNVCRNVIIVRTICNHSRIASSSLWINFF